LADPLGELRSQQPRSPAAFMGGQGSGKGRAGRIKGKMGGYRERTVGEGGKGMKEMRGGLSPTRN